MLFSVFVFFFGEICCKVFLNDVFYHMFFLREAGTFWIVYGRDTIGPRTTCNQVELHPQERFREFIFGWCVKDFSRKFSENSVKAEKYSTWPCTCPWQSARSLTRFPFTCSLSASQQGKVDNHNPAKERSVKLRKVREHSFYSRSMAVCRWIASIISTMIQNHRLMSSTVWKSLSYNLNQPALHGHFIIFPSDSQYNFMFSATLPIS